MIQYLNPKHIVECFGVENENGLYVKKSLQIGLNEPGIIEFSPKSFIIMDFGKEIRGGIRILTSQTEGIATVRIRFGESLSECNAELGEKNASNDHSPRDIKADLVSWSDLCFGDTGFRFVKIELLTERPVKIKAIVAKSYELGRKSNYTYQGTDKDVEKIFNTAKRTIDLCSIGQYVYDGIKRDRLVWVGDMYPEMLALTTLYGRFPALERSLEFAKAQYPLPQMMYDMPTYSLWWILIVCDYYQRTNSKNFVKRQLGYINGLLEVFNGKIREDGQLILNQYFVDWPTVDNLDEYIGAIFIAIAAYKKGIAVLKSFGYDTTNFQQTLSRLYKNDFTVRQQKQVLGLKYFVFGELSDEEYAMLVKGGGQGFSTFMSYFILKAVASKDNELAILLMKEYYGGMLSVGATTFFEDFDLDWLQNSNTLDAYPLAGQKDIHGDFGAYCYTGFRHSLCHGWASGVITFIQENICQ